MKDFLGISVMDDIVNFLEPSLSPFLEKKAVYMGNRTDNNYLELTFAYAAIDADLKSLLNRNVLSITEFRHIREKLKEGL